MVSDSESTLVEIHLSPGNEHDAAHGRVSMAVLGAFMGARLLMDCAYEGAPTRRLAESFGPAPVVPSKRNRTDPWDYDRPAYKDRNIVERVFNRMKHYRKAATRYDRLDAPSSPTSNSSSSPSNSKHHQKQNSVNTP